MCRSNEQSSRNWFSTGSKMVFLFIWHVENWYRDLCMDIFYLHLPYKSTNGREKMSYMDHISMYIHHWLYNILNWWLKHRSWYHVFSTSQSTPVWKKHVVETSLITGCSWKYFENFHPAKSSQCFGHIPTGGAFQSETLGWNESKWKPQRII